MTEIQSLFQKRARYQELLDEAIYVTRKPNDQQVLREKIKEVNQAIKTARLLNEAESKDQVEA